MKNKRLFNYRPICLIFLFLALGTVLAYYMKTDDYIFAIITMTVVIILIVIIAALYKKIKYFLIPLVSLVIGLSAYSIATMSYNSHIDRTPTIVEARIYNVVSISDDYARVYADGVLFDGEKLDEKIIVYIYPTEHLYSDIAIGSVIKFEVMNCYTNDLYYYDTPNANYFSSNLSYTVTASEDSISLVRIDKTFAEKIRSYIKDNLGNGLSSENVELAYSSLFGDVAELGDSTYNAFKLSGVFHLLSVSGLHVAIIVGALYKILDWMRIKKWLKVGIITAILVFYMYICSFSIPVIRATIMALVLLIAPLIHREYDAMSSICLSGIIIIIFNPLSMFDVSFLLSFACAFGITLMYKTFKKIFCKMHMHKTIADGFSLSLSTTVALLFLMAYYFNQLNIISILANVVIIPIFSIVFTIMFIFAIISLIFPFATYALLIINQLTSLCNLLASVFASIPFGVLTTTSINLVVNYIYFALIIFLSRICVAKIQTKILITLPAFALIMVLLLI